MEEVRNVSKKRDRDESEEVESDIESPEVKRIKENLLDCSDDDPEFCTSTQDLDSFMKSFEEEITASPPSAVDGVGVCNPGSDSGESRPDLGYLLEASDDELGIPPPSGLENELGRAESSEIGDGFWEGPGYDGFGFGGGGDEYHAEYVALDGLFDYSDVGIGPNGFPWRPETLPAQ